jgi:general secretion pathway protein D
MRSSVVKLWLVSALILSASVRSWGQTPALLDAVKIPLLAQAEVPAEAAPAAEPAKVPAEAPVVAPVEAPAVVAPVEAPAPAAPAQPVPAPAAPAAEVGIIEEVTIPAAAPAPAAPAELIEEKAPAAEAAPAATVAAPAEGAPVEAAPAEGAVVQAPPAAPVDTAEAAKILAQQVEVRKQEQQIRARNALAEANTVFARKQYAEAAPLYQQVLANMPVTQENASYRVQALTGLSESRYWLIRDLIEKDQLGEAQSLTKTAIADDPSNKRIQSLQVSVDELMKDEEARAEKVRIRQASKPWTSEAVKDRERQVDNLIREGRGYLAVGDYKTAEERFKSALAVDPENKEAMRFLDRTGERRFASSTVELKATAENMIADVRDTWNPRDYKYVAPIVVNTNRQVDTVPDLLVKMEKIIIPEIEFRQANIHDVVDFLVKASIAEDVETQNARDKGVNIILNIGSVAPDAAQPAAADPFAAPAEGVKSGGSISGVPEITFTARYISLLQAIKIITSVAGLKYRVEGKIVMIVPADAPEGDIEHKWYAVEPTIVDIVRSMGTATAEGAGGGFPGEGGELSTRVSSDRGDMEKFFRQMGVDFPKGSSIQYQPTIGRLVVANTARNLALIERILPEINAVPKQVEIEARFVEVNQTDLEELGFEWLLNDNWEVLTKKGGDPAIMGGSERIQIGRNDLANGFTKGLRYFGQNADGELSAVPGGTLGSMMRVQSVLTNPEITMILHALEMNGHADVLSAPKVTTRSGTEATIRVVTEYIYPTEFDIRSGSDLVGTGSGDSDTPVEAKVVALPQNFETREVGVILSVIPEVSPEGNMINLNMRPEVVSDPVWKEYGVTLPDSSGNEYNVSMPQPFFQRRAVETQISIYDGATVVMGGLITEKIVTINDKIPFLGDLPLIGFLFRNKASNSEKRNLLIFVTARLVDPAGKAIRTQKMDDNAAPVGAVAAQPR